MRRPELRNEEPPDDAVVVIRRGLHSLDIEKVIEVCEDSSPTSDSTASRSSLRWMAMSMLSASTSSGSGVRASFGWRPAAGSAALASRSQRRTRHRTSTSYFPLPTGVPSGTYGPVSSLVTTQPSSDEEVLMVRQLTVDFNRVIEGSLIRANARRAVPGTVLDVGSVIVVGDDDWGMVRAEVVEHDPDSGSLVLRLLGELVDEHLGELSRPE